MRERSERGGRFRRRPRDLSPEERAYEEARRLAERKLKFVGHLVPYLFVCTFLLFVTRSGFIATIVGLVWGLGLASHFFQAFIAPELRRKWIQREVEGRVQSTVSRERRALQGEQRRSLEELSASIAHEIRNPITAAKSLLQQMGEDPSSPENVEYAQVALEELDRVERSISHLLRYAREEDMDVQPIRLSEVLEAAVESCRERIATSGVQVRPELDAEGEMEGDAEKLRRVLVNLIGNALDAFDESRTPHPRLELALGENLAGTEVWLRVKDNGPGVDGETQAKMFQPFYTSKSNGTGLGLAISKKLVDAHGGSIEVHSTSGKGSEFVLTFPKRARAPEVSR
jgi:signal transduction histidine kinase